MTDREWFERYAKGKENAVTRENLCLLSNLNDRQVRRMIGQLKDEGLVIVNDRDGEGYYVTDDLDVIEKEYKAVTSMAMTLLKRRKNIRKILKEAGREV